MALTKTMVPLATYNANGSDTTVTFGSGGTLPQTYTDLIIIGSGRLNYSDSNTAYQFNGYTGTTNNTANFLNNNFNTVATVNGSRNNGYDNELAWYGWPSANNTYTGTAFMRIFNYTSNSLYKALQGTHSMYGGSNVMFTGQYLSTSPITSITLLRASYQGGVWQTGTNFTLYGVI